MSRNIYKVWKERVEADEIEPGKIRQWDTAIIPRSMGYHLHQGSGSGLPTSLTEDQCIDLIERFEARVKRDGGPKVTEQQAAFGRKWLAAYAHDMKLPKLDYSTIVCFRFVGGNVVDENSYRATVVPEYDCHFPDGSILRYSVASWMSGVGKYVECRWIKEPRKKVA